LEGLGVKLKLAAAKNGAFTTAENTSTKAVMARAATNSPTSRWGHTCTLSVGDALTSWMEPALTTVRRRWVWPSGPRAAGAGAVATAVAAAGALAAGAAAVAGAPAPLAAAWLRASRWGGILSPASAAPPASGSAAADAPASPPSGSLPRAARRCFERWSRCSGTSVMVSLAFLQGPRDPAVLADPPEVDCHEDDD